MKALTDLGWISDSMLHGSGWGCMLHIEAHFDESGTSAHEITVAGYLFEADRIDLFTNEWNSLLDQHNFPFLHMKDFAPGKKPPYNKLRKPERSKLQMQLMRILKKYAINGIVCNIVNSPDNMGRSYFDAAKGAIGATLDWVNQTTFDGKIAYFFEAGATGQNLLEGEFQQIALDPASAAAHRYAGHAFLPKPHNAGVQAADFLAWQYHNYTKKRAAANLARLDMRSLLRHPHYIIDECGELPRESKIQSTVESRSRIETVLYLQTADPDKKYGTLAPSADFTPLRGEVPGIVLACPKCFRAIAEDVLPSQFSDIVIRCWCKNRCLIPPLLPPFARY